jgi:hypothetical protein
MSKVRVTLTLGLATRTDLRQAGETHKSIRQWAIKWLDSTVRNARNILPSVTIDPYDEHARLACEMRFEIVLPDMCTMFFFCVSSQAAPQDRPFNLVLDARQ